MERESRIASVGVFSVEILRLLTIAVLFGFEFVIRFSLPLMGVDGFTYSSLRSRESRSSAGSWKSMIYSVGTK